MTALITTLIPNLFTTLIMTLIMTLIPNLYYSLISFLVDLNLTFNILSLSFYPYSNTTIFPVCTSITYSYVGVIYYRDQTYESVCSSMQKPYTKVDIFYTVEL